MGSFFSSIINKCIRNLDYGVRVGIGIALFTAAIFLFKMSIRRKNDSHPIAWGWLILSVLSLFLGIVYLTL